MTKVEKEIGVVATVFDHIFPKCDTHSRYLRRYFDHETHHNLFVGTYSSYVVRFFLNKAITRRTRLENTIGDVAPVLAELPPQGRVTSKAGTWARTSVPTFATHFWMAPRVIICLDMAQTNL